VFVNRIQRGSNPHPFDTDNLLNQKTNPTLPFVFGSAFQVLTALSICLVTSACFGQDKEDTPAPSKPIIEQASNEGQEAIAQFKFAKNLKCELFSAEPNVANIVAFHRDYKGDVYVCETFRQGKGVEDNRKHKNWMDDELAAQTVQDRVDYIRKYIPDADAAYTTHDDRIRLLRDSDQNGTPDSVSVFSDRYNEIAMGTGAGVLSYRGKVYYTCIPDLFSLEDADNDGVAEKRESLHTGYGVRFAYRGHDMHGLIVGPDGRLYYSIGDRGYNISPTMKDPASGAVFRCELDGSNLEVVATGLRNPQELAFDDYGNLFTGDNNSDSGDKARWVEVVNGSDSGWRMYYQYQSDRGPFNREKIWHPFNKDESPAYIVPPIDNFSDGPSGLEYYPGTGFGDEFKERFFLCDFRGDASKSGVRSLKNQADGAFWKLVEDEQPFWNMLVTDIDFGSDGKVYLSDWVFGWNGENKGRIYAFSDSAHVDSPLVKQVELLLKNGMKNEPVENLMGLLGHPDQRVRQEAQFELVDRGDVETLTKVVGDSEQGTMARIHAIWGLGQSYRKSPNDSLASAVASAFGDKDTQVAIAAAGMIGEMKYKNPAEVAKLLAHQNLRVRFKAAMSLSQIGTDADLPAIAKMLVENADNDPMVRHGGIMALYGIFKRLESNAVVKLAKHDSRSVRIAVAIAMRKMIESNSNGIYRHKQTASKLVGGMLGDSDSQIVLEAARIIHDLEVESEMPTLATMIDDVDGFKENDALLRRVISANVRVGGKANADSLAKFAANGDYDADRRADAVAALSTWAKPPARMMVLHAWRPLDPNKRNVTDARGALDANFNDLIAGDKKVTGAAIRAAGNLEMVSIGSGLEKVALNKDAEASTRVAALSSLGKLKYAGLNNVLGELESGFDSLGPDLASEVTRLMAKTDEARGLILISNTMKNGQQSAKQSAIATLGTMKSQDAISKLKSLLGQAGNGQLAPELRLDIVTAAESRKEAEFKKLVEAYHAKTTKPNDKASVYVDTLVGGNHDAGSKIFYGKTEVSCVRCHKIDGTGGAVGPELSGVALERKRQYLLEAIVDPNKEIAKGFEQVKVQTDEGDLHVGIVKQETDDLLVLLNADGNEVVIEQDIIIGRKKGQSSMPDDLVNQLTKQEIRDLVEFLSHRKTKPPKAKTEHE